MINVHIVFNRPQGPTNLTRVSHSGKIDVITDMIGNLVLTFNDKKPKQEVRYPLSAISSFQIRQVEVGD